MTLRKSTPRRARKVMLGVATLATSVVIAACGSSSSTTNTTTTSTTTAASASASANRTAFVKCLQQHGVTIPPRTASGGASTTHSGPPPSGSAGPGKGNATRQAAFKACGAPGQHPKTG